jgi:acyl-[acyl-carrier-protein] desaturase
MMRRCCERWSRPLERARMVQMRDARAISLAGIYDFNVHHDQILVPVLQRHWAIAERTDLDPDARKAQESILAHIERVARVASRRDRYAAKAEPSEHCDDER